MLLVRSVFPFSSANNVGEMRNGVADQTVYCTASN